MQWRPFDAAKDREASHRIWREVGWLEADLESRMDAYVDCGRALVAEVHGQAECMVLTAPGVLRYTDSDLPISCVTGVTTSLVARKQGLAGRLTARALAADAAEGSLVSGLGMFEQGFYNRLGFGSGTYINRLALDPALLANTGTFRAPVRLTEEDGARMHACRLARRRTHGSVSLIPTQVTLSELFPNTKQMGLGYSDADGAITHFLWLSGLERSQGPWNADPIFSTREQFRELMALLRSFGDQVRVVKLREPGGIQLQDLVRQPFTNWDATRGSKLETGMRTCTYWQARILDLAGCLARTHLAGEPTTFNLTLSDPVAELLHGEPGWHGVAGEYTVTLGPESSCRPGHQEGLPHLATSVNTFTRMWLGVRPATGLAYTDDLVASPGLAEQLDRTLLLPEPQPDWDF